MKFGIKNLGPIKDADIGIGDLTIVCGKNNCGKTYLAYSLYSFLAIIQRCFVFQISKINEQYFNDCYKKGSCSIDATIIWEKINSLLCNAMFKEAIPFFLTIAPQTLHKELNISAIMEDRDYDKFIKDAQGATRFQVTEKCMFHIKKQAQSSEIIIRIENRGERLPRKENLREMFNVVCSIFFNQMFPDAFSLTGERSGISLFADNFADFSRKRDNISLLVTKLKERILAAQKARLSNQFPLPVTKEVAFFQNLKIIRRRVSYISKEHPRLLTLADELSEGHYEFDDHLGIQYFPENTETPLTLSECSSSVKSLVEFNFYLRHCAKRNQILMIDEPELNLHPANQRKLARLLAQLVNAGIRVFITTHSDYIIREFNTLIQLKQPKPYIAKIKQTEGYSDSELLDASRILAYVAKRQDDGVIFDTAPISQEEGITISALDEVIDKMNQIQDAIIWGGEDYA